MNKDVQNYLELLLPTQPLFDARRVIGSILGFDFGEPEAGKSPIYLAIEMAEWLLCHENEVILDSEETNDDIYEEVLKNLMGKRITKFVEKKIGHEIDILFDDNYRFVLKSNTQVYDEEDDLFFINQKNNPSLGYDAKQGFNFENQTSSKP